MSRSIQAGSSGWYAVESFMNCKACGKELPGRKEGRGRPRLFCDKACRFNAWIMRHGPYTPKPAPGRGRLRERETLIREYYAKMGIKF